MKSTRLEEPHPLGGDLWRQIIAAKEMYGYYDLYRMIVGVYQLQRQKVAQQQKLLYISYVVLILISVVSVTAFLIYYSIGEFLIAASFLGPLLVAIPGLVMLPILKRRVIG